MKIIGDKPLSSTKLFNFDIYGETLANVIIGENTVTPLVVGIFGDLGSGRTTLMRITRRNIKLNDPKVKIIWFNAHEQSIAGNTLSGPSLLYYIYHELGGKKTKSNQLEKLGKGILEIVGEVGTRKFLGLTLGEVKSKFEAQAISGYSLAEDFKLAVNEYLNREKYNRIVVFIDDIDICHPETAIGILESIKFFLKSEGCIFVLGMDKKIMSEYYQAYFSYFFKYIEMKSTISDYFLEKIIELSFHIPPPSNKNINEFINISIPDFYKTSPYIDMIIRGVGNNPRKLKLLFNIMELQQGLIKSIPELQREITDEQNKKRFMALLLEWTIINTYYEDFPKEADKNILILLEIHTYLESKIKEYKEFGLLERPKDLPKSIEPYWNNKQLLEMIMAFQNEIDKSPKFEEIERVITLFSNGETEEEKKKPEILSRYQIIQMIKKNKSLKKKNIRGVDLAGLSLIGMDLSYSDLTNANLVSAKLVRSNLKSAVLNNADLEDAILRNVNLCYATLKSANLKNAKLIDAVLSNADLEDSNLSEADLINAVLMGANLKGAKMNGAKLFNVNLKNAKFNVNTDFRNVEINSVTIDNLEGSNWEDAIWDVYWREKIKNKYKR